MRSTSLAWAVCVASLVGCGGSSASAPTEDAGAREPVDASHDSGGKPESDASPRPSRDGGTDGARDDAAPDDSAAAPLLKVDIRCATAAVVGLEWAAVEGATHYAVSRGGSALGTTATPGLSDTSVAASTAYSYSVTAYDKNDKTLITNGAQVTTAAALPDGDAPYCQSELIKSATWNWGSGFNQQNGSDLWPSTWGADGSVYLFFGDGGGFFGSDTNGRASFGIARITGSDPVVNASTASNVYGGLNAAHPSTINGKAGSIFSVGNDFYALGGVYRSGEGGPAGSPNHYEIIASMGNAYSWQDTSWTFCAADAAGNVTQGTLCAAAFVHFGAGNAGAFDDNVYMLAVSATGWFSSVGVPGPASTYMMRAPASALTTESAYTYYAGLDATGAPIWSSMATSAVPMFVDKNTRPMGLGAIVYNTSLKRFIGAAQDGNVSGVAVYEASQPWGPWSTIRYDNVAPNGSGGWGDLGSTSYTSGHGDSLGVNFINAFTSADGLTMWAVFSSDGTAPSTALLPGLANNSMDSFSLVSLTLGM